MRQDLINIATDFAQSIDEGTTAAGASFSDLNDIAEGVQDTFNDLTETVSDFYEMIFDNANVMQLAADYLSKFEETAAELNGTIANLRAENEALQQKIQALEAASYGATSTSAAKSGGVGGTGSSGSSSGGGGAGTSDLSNGGQGTIGNGNNQ